MFSLCLNEIPAISVPREVIYGRLRQNSDFQDKDIRIKMLSNFWFVANLVDGFVTEIRGMPLKQTL